MKVCQPKHHIMLRQENAALRYVRKSLRGAQHKYGRNITRVAEPVGCRRTVFLPQQCQGHVRPTQIAMHRGPVRYRALIGRNIRRRRKEQRLELRVAQPTRQRPRQPSATGPLEVIADRALAQSQAICDNALW
jgi:hypothetical protein